MIRRIYSCSDCGHQFRALQDKSEPLLTDCPACATASASHDTEQERLEGEERLQRMLDSGVAPGVLTNKTRAMNTADKMREEMGFSDFNDSGRAGDIAAKAPSKPQGAEAEAMTREMLNAGALKEEQAQEFNAAAKNLFQTGEGGFWEKDKKAKAGQPKMIVPGGGMAVPQAPPVAAIMPRAAANAQAARREGVDPISLLHANKAERKIRYQVEAAVRGK